MYIWNFKGFLNELEGATFQKRIFFLKSSEVVAY